jgi:GT2 family glycosyltransferase
MDVSVTIVNWNRAVLLEQCLRSVFATPAAVSYEVIVVDNGSHDDSVAMVRSLFPQVAIIPSPVNIGFAAAQNHAIAAARGRYVLVLNNDATVRPDTIPNLVELMERHPDVACCTCAESSQLGLGSPKSGAFRRFPSLGRTFAENLWAVLRPPRSWDPWLMARLRRWIGKELMDVDILDVAWCVGALLMVRREPFVQLGGFDEGFFLFDEDVDLCRRLQDRGWRVAFTTATRYDHRGGGSSALRNDIERIRGDSRAWYFRKYHGPLVTALFRLQHFVLQRCLLSCRRRLERFGKPAGYTE